MEKENYFLGSVGKVEAFLEHSDGTRELAFVSKTLTDSGINTSITADDIRAGQGAPIVTRFYHDPSVEITLTDVMFKRAYIEAQLGAKFNEEKDGAAGANAFQSEGPIACTSDEKKLTLSKAPLPFDTVGCVESAEPIVWYTKEGENDWKIATEVNGLEITGEFERGSKYCVRYLAYDVNSYVAKIYSDIVPQELHLIITVPLYAGDSCAPSQGHSAGEVQFDVPRFRLNGSQDFAAAMSSNQTMSLAGSAMASQSGCSDSSVLYIMRVKYNASAEAIAKRYVALESLNSAQVVDDAPVVFGVKEDLTVDRLSNDLLLFVLDLADTTNTALKADGTWKQTGDAYIKLVGSTTVAPEKVTIGE